MDSSAETSSAAFSSSELSFFVDRDIVITCINVICDSTRSSDWEKQWEVFSFSLAKYQEQPLLLNSALEEMMAPLCARLLLLSEIIVATDRPASDENQIAALEFVCKCIQLICRVRGYKYILSFFPHEVSQLEVNVKMLNLQVSGLTRPQ